MTTKNGVKETATNCIAVIGCGHVGATSAYVLMTSGIAREIILIDKDSQRAAGEAADLQHASSLTRPVNVRAGDYDDAAQADIAVIAAGVGSVPGETRLDLLARNVRVVRECMSSLLAAGFSGIVLMTTNPVDILAQIAQEESGLPVECVIGSGTVLDSARLRQMLGAELGVEPRSVHAYIIGEHGDSEIAAWSCAYVAGVPLSDFRANLATGETLSRTPDFDSILGRVRRAAGEIIERKGYTSFAIASCVARICEAILRDERTILPVSTLMQSEYGITGVYLSTPCVIGRMGVERRIELKLNDEERAGVQNSADVLRQSLAKLRQHESSDGTARR